MRHILVVEDETLIRLDVVESLTCAGFDILEAGTADEALRILYEKDSVFLLFTDVHMPGTLSGLELAHHVYKHWPHIKILVVSSLMDAQTIKLPFGATFFSKPYEHGKVVDLARQHSA